MLDTYDILENIVMAKQGRSKYINVPRVLNDIQRIRDAKDTESTGGNIVEQLLAAARGQQPQAQQPVDETPEWAKELIKKTDQNHRSLTKLHHRVDAVENAQPST